MVTNNHRHPLINLESVSKTYRMGATDVTAVDKISFVMMSGDYYAITGPSGSGKSTLLQIIGCLDTPTDGRYLLDGKRVDDLTDDELSTMRNKTIGFVFQSFHLMSHLNIMENVELPLLYRSIERGEREDRVAYILEKVGLTKRRTHRSNELSGGERQRVAIARALVGEPKLLLADEPTGNLDQQTGNEIMDVLESLNDEGVTILLVTHDPEKANRTSCTVRMLDGQIVS
jgi:putative ABC transport system ATP-binding protein